MRLLLDTHVLLWIFLEPNRLPPRVAEAIRTPRNEVYVSAVSTWEIAIKAGLGRVEVPFEELETTLADTGVVELPVTIAHTLLVRDLPDHHRDPFDRLLVAQALAEAMTLVTHDHAIRDYAIPTMWE